MTDKKWAEMTKEERAAKIKAGQDAAKARRSAEPEPDLDAMVAAAVAKALAVVKGSDAVTGKASWSDKKFEDMTDAERKEMKAEHDRLQAALEALPFEGERAVGTLPPGTRIGEGVSADYVPYTHAWFEDVSERRLDRNKHNGRPAELRWPNYQLHDVFFQGTKPEIVGINGCFYGLLPGMRCLLPTPFYGVLRDQQEGLARHAKQFAPPTPSTNPGYFHVNVSQDNGRPVAVLLGKGPLDPMEVREANDAKYPQ